MNLSLDYTGFLMKSEKRIRSNKLLKFIEKQAGKPAMMGLAFPYEYIIINDY
jgi:hypothetical protein